jgi:putative ABC transport system ATP-binding protein
MTSSPAPSRETAAVDLIDISRRYRADGAEVHALRGVTLSIPARRFAVVKGPSGSGKTTLLNMIGCLDRPDSGRIRIAGEDVSTLSDDRLSDFRARALGFIFQNFNLIPTLSVFENVEYPLLMLRVAPAERRERVGAMLEAVGLSDQAKRRPNALSGGQKQRVAIARALVKRPTLVLADEPTANLDSATGEAIVALMHRMQSELDTTFVFSTHDRDLISRSDDRFSLRDGTLVEVVTAGEVRA